MAQTGTIDENSKNYMNFSFDLLPTVTNNFTLGEPSYIWSTIYSNNIRTSNLNDTDISNLDTRKIGVSGECLDLTNISSYNVLISQD